MSPVRRTSPAALLPALLLAALLAGVFLARQRTLTRWQARMPGGPAREVNPPAAPPVPDRTAPSPVGPPEPSAADHAELLRLRGGILPLRQEVAALSNQLVTLTRPPAPLAPWAAFPDTKMAVEAETAQAWQAFMHGPEHAEALALGRELAAHLVRHGRQLPAGLEEFALTPRAEKIVGRFELIRSGTVPEGDEFALIARAREPHQLADGNWVWVYLDAGGHTVVAGPAPELDAAAWEESYTAQQRQMNKNRRPAPAP